jgi:cytochrome c oxidase cbb3-type subunit 2
MNARSVALVAGFLFLALAAFVQGVLPMLEPQSRHAKVTKVVRTDFGELKWMENEATDYTEVEALGRAVYTREGCWYCHSQFVRPVTGETRRWGPVSQSGESVFDVPHLFSTRRIGPDLTRVGLKYSDEWHLAHFWNPRMVVPGSIMPRYARLFELPDEAVRIVTDDAGNRSLERTPTTEAVFDFASQAQIRLTPNAEGLLFVPERSRYPVIFTPNEEYTGDTVQLAVMTQELEGLIAYVQKLGMNRGKWRDRFPPQRLEASQGSREAPVVLQPRGLLSVSLAGLAVALPALGLFKFRLTPSNSMPTDGDLLRTITRGVRGTAMPPWHTLPEKDRLAAIQYIKYELSLDRSDPTSPYAYFIEEPPKPPLHIGEPPPPSREMVAHGKEVWQQAKCWECHGQTGKGDGEKAPGLKDDWGFPAPPADLTTGQFKSGPSVEDIFRTMSTGLRGTPMPSYRKVFPEEDRWALAYYVVSLSAFTDPLTGKPLQIAAEDRAALNDPGVKATESHYAYKSKGSEPKATDYAGEPHEPVLGGEAWAERHGMELLSPARAVKPAVSAELSR